jgi:predicted nucleotidyltransferase
VENVTGRSYNIFMDKDLLIRRLVSLKPELSAEGVSHLALFGSRARGDYSAESDIDLLLEVDPSSRFSILNLVGVEQIVERETGIPANVFMRRSLDREFQTSIKNDVVEVF